GGEGGHRRTGGFRANGTLERFAEAPAAHQRAPDPMLAEILKIHQSGRLDEAEQRYNDWLAQHPEDAEALNGLAILRRQKDDLAGAIELSRKAVALAPRRDDFQMTL